MRSDSHQQYYFPQDFDLKLEIGLSELYAYERNHYAQQFQAQGAAYRAFVLDLKNRILELLLEHGFAEWEERKGNEADAAYLKSQAERYAHQRILAESRVDEFPEPHSVVIASCIYDYSAEYMIFPETTPVQSYLYFFALKLRSFTEQLVTIKDFLRYQYVHRFTGNLAEYQDFLGLCLEQYAAALIPAKVAEQVKKWRSVSQELPKPSPPYPSPYISEDLYDDQALKWEGKYLLREEKTLAPSKSPNKTARPSTLRPKIQIRSNCIVPLAKILEEYFPESSSEELIQVLRGARPAQKLRFHDHSYRLIGVFYQLREKGILRSLKKVSVQWLCDTFLYCKDSPPRQFIPSHVDKEMSPQRFMEKEYRQINLKALFQEETL